MMNSFKDYYSLEELKQMRASLDLIIADKEREEEKESIVLKDKCKMLISDNGFQIAYNSSVFTFNEWVKLMNEYGLITFTKDGKHYTKHKVVISDTGIEFIV